MDKDKHATSRLAHDGYQTPIDSITPLLRYVDFRDDPTYFEPCRGDGHIYDLIPCRRKNYCEIKEGKDYLAKHRLTDVDIIITNPPFNQALDFLQKSLREAHTVIYLLRLSFLASQTRKAFWQSHKPTHIFILTKRPSFTGNGTDNTDYMWCCWDRGNRIKTLDPITWL